MHRDIIIITTYCRPEFLYLTLENIYRARGSENKEVWIYHDKKFDDETYFEKELQDTAIVVAYWKDVFGDRLNAVMREPTGYYGNSYNVLEAYKKAYQTDAKYVYMIEDDVFITPDFFEWHEKAQRLENFCSIAGKRDNLVCPHPESDCFISSEYASLGVCFPRENLQCIVSHANRSYYANLGQYILQKFPASKLGTQAQEQDGMIQRVMEQLCQLATWSTHCKAFHIGIYGYHRILDPAAKITGNLAGRIEMYRIALSDQNWLTGTSGGIQTDLQAFPRA